MIIVPDDATEEVPTIWVAPSAPRTPAAPWPLLLASLHDEFEPFWLQVGATNESNSMAPQTTKETVDGNREFDCIAVLPLTAFVLNPGDVVNCIAVDRLTKSDSVTSQNRSQSTICFRFSTLANGKKWSQIDPSVLASNWTSTYDLAIFWEFAAFKWTYVTDFTDQRNHVRPLFVSGFDLCACSPLVHEPTLPSGSLDEKHCV